MCIYIENPSVFHDPIVRGHDSRKAKAESARGDNRSRHCSGGSSSSSELSNYSWTGSPWNRKGGTEGLAKKPRETEKVRVINTSPLYVYMYYRALSLKSCGIFRNCIYMALRRKREVSGLRGTSFYFLSLFSVTQDKAFFSFVFIPLVEFRSRAHARVCI